MKSSIISFLVLTLMFSIVSFQAYSQTEEEFTQLYQDGEVYVFDRPDTALTIYQECLSIAQGTKNDTIIAKAYNRLALVYDLLGQIDTSTYLNRKAYNLAKQIGMEGLMSIILNDIGVTYYFQGLRDSALFYYERCYTESKNNVLKAMALDNIANIRAEQGYYIIASQNRLKAIPVYQNLVDSLGKIVQPTLNDSLELVDAKESLAKSYMNLGVEYYRFGDNALGLSYMEKANANSPEHKFGFRVELYANISSVYIAMADYEKAIALLENRAIPIIENVSYKHPISMVYSNLGTSHKLNGDLIKGEEYLLKALALKEEINDANGIGHVINNLAHLYLEKGDLAKGLEYIKRAEQILANVPNPFKKRELLNLWMGYYERTQEFEKAYDMSLEVISLDSANRVTNRESTVQELNIIHETELREKEQQKLAAINKGNESTIKAQTKTIQYSLGFALVLLITIAIIIIYAKRTRKLNTELEQKRQALYQANQAKDKLFAIISHDLRAPAVALQSMVKANAGDAQQKASNLLDILDGLLQWSHTQTSGMEANVQPVDMEEVIEEAIAEQKQHIKEKNIQLKHHINNDVLCKADRNMMPIVVRNLLSNAVKFTLVGGNVVVAVASTSGNGWELAVTDSGKGFSKEQIAQLETGELMQSSAGTQGEKGLGVGLTIVKDLVAKMGGALSIEGNTVKVVFKW